MCFIRPLKTEDMIEKVQVTDTSVLKSIEDGLNKSTLGNSLASYVPATIGEIWITYLDSNKNIVLIPWQNWDVSRNNAIGVAIMSSGKRLIISPHETFLAWGAVAGTGGAVVTANKTMADADYAGKSNTSKIIASDAFKNDGPDYAPGYCATYSNGGLPAGSWWLPSLGELGLIYEKYDAINAAMARIKGSEQLNKATYWSSTEVSVTDAWVTSLTSSLRWGSHKYGVNSRVRPVTSF